MKKKRIYKKYQRMNHLHASELYGLGKISYEKYQIAFYSRFMNENNLINLIYG